MKANCILISLGSRTWPPSTRNSSAQKLVPSSSRRRAEHASRDPVSLRMSSGVPLSTSYVIVCAYMTHLVVNWGPNFEEKRHVLTGPLYSLKLH